MKRVIIFVHFFIVFIILLSFVTPVYASQVRDDFYLTKLEKIYEIEDQGISYTVVGNKITKDDKFYTQSIVSLVNLPRGVEVIKSYIYWSGEVLSVSAADTSVDLTIPSNRTYKISADEAWSTLDEGLIYLCRADVTKYVKSNGTYLIKNVDLDPIRDKYGNLKNIYGSWSLLLVYKVPRLMSTSKVVVYNGLDSNNIISEEGHIKTEIVTNTSPPLTLVHVMEERPEDVLFYLKKGNYGIAIAKSPIFTLSYIFEMRKNIAMSHIKKSMLIVRPYLVRMVSGLAVFFIAYAILINIIYLSLTVIAAYWMKRYLKENRNIEYSDFIGKNKVQPISILISAYNEELTIGRTVAALLRLKYPKYEMIVINDGSKDKTLEVLKKEYALGEIEPKIYSLIPTYGVSKIFRSAKFKNLYVIDKENSGKADSLNAGINFSNYPLFCTVDADTILEENALFQLALPILKNPREVVATTGMVRLLNGCTIENGVIVKRELPTTFLAIIQVLEYIRAYSIGRIGWNIFNAHVIVSGTFSLYKKNLVVALGGYHRYAIGEDVELNMRIHKTLLEKKQLYRISYVPAAQCLTQAPVDLKSLARQRNRWHRGLITSMRLNTHMLFNPKYGPLGLFVVPFYAIFEFPAPILELFGYIIMPLLALFKMLSIKYMLILLGLVIMYGAGLSLLSVVLDMKYFKFYNKKAYAKILFYLFFESFGFHQLTVFWRTKGIFDYLKEVHVRSMGWRSPDRLEVA